MSALLRGYICLIAHVVTCSITSKKGKLHKLKQITLQANPNPICLSIIGYWKRYWHGWAKRQLWCWQEKQDLLGLRGGGDRCVVNSANDSVVVMLFPKFKIPLPQSMQLGVSSNIVIVHFPTDHKKYDNSFNQTSLLEGSMRYGLPVRLFVVCDVKL